MTRRAFRVDQPLPNDLVGNPVLLAGSGGGFEGQIDVRLLDSTGAVVHTMWLHPGHSTVPWQGQFALPESFTETRGVIEIGPQTGRDEMPAWVSAPVFFGDRILPGFKGYFVRVVQAGDTLSGIANDYDPGVFGGTWQQIFEANRDILADANLIHPGQALRIPHK